MAQGVPSINYFQKLSTLIEGYKGYRSPRIRIATTELYEAFLSEKLKTILRIIEDKYNELINEKRNLQLLIPLSNIIKNLTDSFHYVTYERSQRRFFLHEYRFQWPGVEENLYKIDFIILQYVSMLVDKISHFEEESKKRFEDFIPIVLMFREKLSERKKFIYGINEKLAPVNQLLNDSLREIRDRHITEETFKNISKAIELFPDRLNTYMDLFEAIHRYSSYYVRINENIPLIDSEYISTSKNSDMTLRKLSAYRLWLHIQNTQEEPKKNHNQADTPFLAVYEQDKDNKIENIYQQHEKKRSQIHAERTKNIPNYYYVLFPETYAFN